MKNRDARGFSLIELILVVGITIVVAAITVPMSGNAIGFFRLSGDARSLTNAISVTKMRAASDFTQARLYVDRSAKTHHLETYRKAAGTTPAGWVWKTGVTQLSQNTTLSYGSLATPPTNTQPTIAQAPACRNDAGAAITNTACIVFNSRGIPIQCDSISATLGCLPGTPTSNGAIYLTDGTAVYGATIIATGMIQMWRSPPGAAAWVKQ